MTPLLYILATIGVCYVLAVIVGEVWEWLEPEEKEDMPME